MKRVYLIISGDLQGVGFRAFVVKAAKKLSIVGWVKNRRDKTVKIVGEGDKDTLERFVGMCHKGPALAVIKNSVVDWQEATGEFVAFEVVY